MIRSLIAATAATGALVATLIVGPPDANAIECGFTSGGHAEDCRVVR